MDRQIDVLTWMHTYYPDEELPLPSGVIYEDYEKDQEYTGTQASFSEILGKLKNKGLLESPAYGNYDITDRGEKKAEYTLNPEDFEGEKPENYGKTVQELVFFLDIEKLEEVNEAIIKGKKYTIKLPELEKYNPELVDVFENQPKMFMDALNEAAEEAGDSPEKIRFELEIGVDYFKKPIYEARSSENIEQVLTVEGTVEYSTAPYQELVSAIFECSQCGDRYEKEQDSSELKSPYKCDCGSRKFEVVEEEYQDILEFRVTNTEEENQNIKGILKPDNLSSDVKNAFRPGSKIKVTGILDTEKKSKNSSKKNPYLEVISFQSEEKEISPENIDSELKEKVKEKVKRWDRGDKHPFEVFSQSIAPNIVGNRNVKKVFSAGLIGGSALKDDGRIHVYIIGNPGTGKSDIQEYVGDTFPNSHYADVANATSVGLTATVENDDNGAYKLVAGKLVYADKGILSLDEFDDINEREAKRLNRAMQKGMFSIDKASQHAELPGEATIIATANYQDIVEEEDFIKDFLPNVHESVQDRFSLKYCMPPREDNEEAINSILGEFSGKAIQRDEASLDEEEQVVYREIAKKHNPVLTDEAKGLLARWIKGQEEIANTKFDRPEMKGDSVRYVVSLGKLATMFARSRFSKTAERRDAEKAIELFSMCRNSLGIAEGETLGQKRKNRKLSEIKDAFDDLYEENDSDKGVYVQDLVEEVDLDEDEAEDAIQSLKSRGEFHEPQSGMVQKV